ncbi:hypothetical protein CC1G_05367 [Coprinopsis cinerea okayama7|uniref:Uncharacterized protein n=1 Tax=Coprinopsis cinerea (strain Okayama-7 / 130 / ATCC MYA-4618 / FGSC 9003) TaxID=240176 RepID=A8NPU6_COPC7|nr:hypothetical protein CC1G_05367 [Coprinopsis cinerea okayama7\|eukprot:XP_001835405.1 hypothetical protein CC1G_05367 [Coprinopsis cinerea okayama7\
MSVELSPELKLRFRGISVIEFTKDLSLVDIGVQLFMVLYGLSVFLESPRESRRGRIPYIIISFAILILTAIASSLDAIRNTRINFFTMVRGIDDYTTVYFTIDREWERFVASFFTSLSVIIGDGLLLYRCWIIWKDVWWAIVLPTILYLTVTGLHIYQTSVRALTKLLNRADPAKFSATGGYVHPTVVALTIILNILITSMIAYRLIRAQRTLSKVLPGRNMKVYSGAVGILIESAFPLTFFGIGSTITEMLALAYVERQPWWLRNMATAGSILNGFYYTFVALSPQMIIFRVTTGRSWMRHEETIHTKTRPLSQPIVFNHGSADVDESLLESSNPPVSSPEADDHSVKKERSNIV